MKLTETQLADLLGMTVGEAEQKMNETITEWIESDSNLQTFLEAMGLFPLQSTTSIMVTGICIGWAEAQRQAAEDRAMLSLLV
jgi:hypothetical protein